MRKYNKIKQIYSELTQENYKYTEELDSNIKRKILEAIQLEPIEAIKELSEILEKEKQGNSLLYAVTFYKKLLEHNIGEILFVSTPKAVEPFNTSDEKLLKCQYHVLINETNPRIICPLGKTDSIFMNVKPVEEAMSAENKKCGVYDLSRKDPFSQILRSPDQTLRIKQIYQEMNNIEIINKEENPQITLEEYNTQKEIYDSDKEKEEFLTEDDFKIKENTKALNKDDLKEFNKIELMYKLYKKYSENKYKYDLNTKLTKRQEKEQNELLKMNPKEAFGQCHEYIENYNKGNPLIFAGAVMHELLKNGHEGYIAHITLGQNIQEYSDNMLQYEELFPAIKIDNSKEFYIIMPLGDSTLETIEGINIIEDEKNEESNLIQLEYEMGKDNNIFKKASDIVYSSDNTGKIEISFNKFSPSNNSNKSLGEILRTKERTMKFKEDEDFDR